MVLSGKELVVLGDGEALRSALPPSEGLKLPSAASLTRCPQRDQEGEPEDLRDSLLAEVRGSAEPLELNRKVPSD